MADFSDITPEVLDKLADRLGEVESYLHLDEKRGRIIELERQSAQPRKQGSAHGISSFSGQFFEELWGRLRRICWLQPPWGSRDDASIAPYGLSKGEVFLFTGNLAPTL